MSCLNEKELSSYLDEDIAEAERGRLEKHLSECGHCLDLLIVAGDAARIRNKARGPGKGKNKNALIWFLAALSLFGLSFAFRRFFAQFLVGAVVLGFKWAMEGEGAKKAIMIFRGMEKKEKKFERKTYPPVSNITGGDSYGEDR